uniref:Uncharacterized protein n=1 Tax=Ixodes scapularis TaxID=6945 RepID=A0A4D5RWP5_IXOSC
MRASILLQVVRISGTVLHAAEATDGAFGLTQGSSSFFLHKIVFLCFYLYRHCSAVHYSTQFPMTTFTLYRREDVLGAPWVFLVRVS